MDCRSLVRVCAFSFHSGCQTCKLNEPENESGSEEQHQQHHCPEPGIHQVLDLRRSGAYTIMCKTKQQTVVKAALVRWAKWHRESGANTIGDQHERPSGRAKAA